MGALMSLGLAIHSEKRARWWMSLLYRSLRRRSTRGPPCTPFSNESAATGTIVAGGGCCSHPVARTQGRACLQGTLPRRKGPATVLANGQAILRVLSPLHLIVLPGTGERASTSVGSPDMRSQSSHIHKRPATKFDRVYLAEYPVSASPLRTALEDY